LADQSVIAVLTFLHIVTAMGWLGGVAFFLSAVGPGVRAFTQPALLEYLTKVGPKQIGFFAGTATGTIVFGLALLFAAFGTDYSSWPNYIETGFGFGLIAYLVAMAVTLPTVSRVSRIAHQAMSGPPGPPPPELPKLLRRANMATMAVALLLLLALVFMVSSAVFA